MTPYNVCLSLSLSPQLFICLSFCFSSSICLVVLSMTVWHKIQQNSSISGALYAQDTQHTCSWGKPTTHSVSLCLQLININPLDPDASLPSHDPKTRHYAYISHSDGCAICRPGTCEHTVQNIIFFFYTSVFSCFAIF